MNSGFRSRQSSGSIQIWINDNNTDESLLLVCHFIHIPEAKCSELSGLRAEIAQREEARLAEEARCQEEQRRQQEAWGRREEELARAQKETDQEVVQVLEVGFIQKRREKVVAAVWGGGGRIYSIPCHASFCAPE